MLTARSHTGITAVIDHLLDNSYNQPRRVIPDLSISPEGFPCYPFVAPSACLPSPPLPCPPCSSPSTSAQDQTNAIVAQVKASVKDPTKPFTLVLTVQVKEGAGDRFEAGFAKAVTPTRREKGCLAYELNRDPKTSTNYLLYERWQSLAALETHLRSEYITTLLGQIGELVAAPPEVRVWVPVSDGNQAPRRP